MSSALVLLCCRVNGVKGGFFRQDWHNALLAEHNAIGGGYQPTPQLAEYLVGSQGIETTSWPSMSNS